MSKQPPPRRPAQGGRPSTPSKASRPVEPLSGGTTRIAPTGATGSGRPSSGSQRRTTAGTQPAARKGSFVLRPLDIGLIVLGLAIVGAIIYGGLNGAKPPASIPAAAVTPGNGSSTAVAQQPANDPSQRNPIANGKPAPDFSLPGTDGKTYTLSQFLGKVVMLEFMAPWCPHCQADAPIFNGIYNKYKDKGVQAFGISATPWDHNTETRRANNQTPTPIAMDDLLWFRDNFKVPYPMLFDQPKAGADPDSSLKEANDYGILYYPTIYIIGKDGTVHNSMITEPGNPLNDQRISAALDLALAGK